MSWSINVHATPADEFADTVEVIRADYDENVVAHFAEEQREPTRGQMAAAIAAACAVVAGGTVGDTVRATLSGHANVGHQPSESYADEIVTIALAYSRPE